MWSVATSKCLCLAKEVKELVHLVFFFSLERQFHANEKCSKGIIQRIQDLLGKELCSGVLSVMATVLCNLLSRLGRPSFCWTKGREPETSSLLHLWPPSPLADSEMPSGIVWVHDSFSRHLVPELSIQILSEFITWPATAALLLHLTHQLPRRRQGAASGPCLKFCWECVCGDKLSPLQ